MALTLEQMRTFVRTSLDLEEEDLPNTLIDTWAKEGSKRVERAELRWPFYETILASTLDVNAFGLYPLSGFAADLESVAAITMESVGSLRWVGIDAFNDLQRTTSTGRPAYFSQWGNNLVVYPSADASYNVTIRGYRTPNDWVAEGAGGAPDMPEELHNTVLTWILCKAYAQQEDPEMAAFYERQYADELNEFRRRLVFSPHPQPLVLNGGFRSPNDPGRMTYDWEAAGS